MDNITGLDLYNGTANIAATEVISRYSTSFSLASRLLGSRVRSHVRNIYGLVRVADEIVDGPGAQAGLSARQQRQHLDDLERETTRAIAEGFSSNLVVHAFARTARECAIEHDLIAPFFQSMRTDIDTTDHDERSHDEYVYGSAEVVGLMCLAAFTNAGRSPKKAPSSELVDGARALGRAFQDVNFFRDAHYDNDQLGRHYIAAQSPTERAAMLDQIENDLDTARAMILKLPKDCRRAVATAHDLFRSLTWRLRSTGDLTQRVSVPTTEKLRLVSRTLLGAQPLRRKGHNP